jgi:hypothetical protein
MIPNCYWRGIAFMIHSKMNINNTSIYYPIEPQVKPTSKYPLSDIDKEEGAPSP